MSYQVVLWTPGEPLGELSAERVAEIQGIYTGPLVAVIDETGGVAIIQPMDPNTGENWNSPEEALAFGERYLNPPQDEPEDNSRERSRQP